MNQKTGTLRSQIMTSAKLSSLRFVSDVALRLISTVVISRLLSPDVYGVFAIVLAYMFFLEMFSDLGLRSLILTKEAPLETSFLRTCWTVSVLRGFTVLVVSVVIALVISRLQILQSFPDESAYSDPVLPFAIATLGAASLIFGFESPLRFMQEREMVFGRVILVDLTRNVVTLIVTIALAYSLRSVWALAIGGLVRSTLHVGLSFLVFRGPSMSWYLDRDSLRLLIARGKWVLSQSIVTAFSQSLDRVLLGAVMSSSTFGLYYIARQLVDMVPHFLNAVNAPMILQVFSRLQNGTPTDFRKNYYRYRLILDTLAGGAAGGLLVLAPLVVDIVFDDRYRDVAPIMQVITLSILLTGLLIMRDAFNAARQFKIGSVLGLLSMCVLALGLGVAVFVMESVTVALYVVALHRLPEAICLTVLGWRNGWVTPVREALVLGFCAVGMALGWLILELWNRIL